MGQSSATGTISNVLIEHNTIKNVFRPGGTAFGADGPNASGINIGCGWRSTGNLASPIIRYNDISDLSGGVVYGIALQGNTPGAQVYGNTFDNLAASNGQYAAGLCIFNNIDPVNGPLGTNNGTGISAHNNAFTDSYYGIYNATTNVVDGTLNWWGDATGPQHPITNSDGLGTHVSDYVLYDLWWANDQMNVYGSNRPVKNVTRGLFYDTIQAAINEAVAGEEITVAAGLYNEAVNVNKRLTLTGAGSALTTISSTGVVLTATAGANAIERTMISGFKLIGGLTGIIAGSYTTLNDIVADGHTNYGINLNPLTDLVITNSSFINNLSAGLKLSSGASASNISINGCHFDNNDKGWYSDASSSVEPSLDAVSIVNTTFSGNTLKGFYTERLSNSVFDNVTVNNNGSNSYVWGAGMDLNLKWKHYENITIQNSTFSNCGVGSLNGVGLTIKGRDDGSTYGANPATLSCVLIDNVVFNGNKNGLNFGEPGQNNAGATNAEVKNCTFNNLEMAINNFSMSDVTALTNNTFTGTTNDFEIEEVIYHKVDNPVKGLVKWIEDSIYVPANQTIQAAISAASPEDEIIIEGGTYHENLLIDRMVSLRPLNREPIILDGGGSGSVITITANGVEVLGLTIQNSGSGQTDAGVLIQGATGCLIQGNTLTDNGHGVLTIMGGANTIKQNIVTGNDYYGFAFVGSSGNTIELNAINGNGLDAIAMINAEDLGHPEILSSANHIKTNTISSVRDGVFIGEACNGNFVTDNNTITAASIGVSVWRPSGQTITDNTITGCLAGIRLLGSSNNTITGNMISANQTGMEIEGSWQEGVWYSCDNNTITNNRIMNNAIYGINASEAHQNLVTAEQNYWGDPAGPTNVRTGNSVINVDYDPWWINYDMTILSSNVTISLTTTEHLIKDLETRPYTVTLAQVEDLRGFNVQIKVPIVDYQIPTNFAIGPLFQAGNNSFFTFDSSDLDYWMIDVTGSYDGGTSLNGPNLVLFTFDLTSAEDASNLVGSQIELPLAQVLMYSETNQYIPCAGTTGEVVIIDSDEPGLTPIADLGTLMIDPAASEPGFPKVVATYLNLSFSDDYNLDTIDYLIQASGADPEFDDFGINIASLIDALAWDNDAWQIPDATLNAAVDNLATGDYTIYFRAVDDAGNFLIEGINFTINRSVPTPIVWAAGSLACRTAEDYNNGVVLNWLYDDQLYVSQTPHTSMNFDVWYLNYDDLENAGGYPLYNPAEFIVPAIPPAPNPYSVDGVDGLWTRDYENDPGWDPEAIPSYSHLHLINDRGYYYYVVFARDAFGNMSPASEVRESIS